MSEVNCGKRGAEEVAADGKRLKEEREGEKEGSRLPLPQQERQQEQQPHPQQEECERSDSMPSSKPSSSSKDAISDPYTGAKTRLLAAVSHDKGARQTMEDIAVIQLDARTDPDNQKTRVAFLAVLDGHGGSNCATLAAESLHSLVLPSLLSSPQVAAGSMKVEVKAAKAAIVEGYKRTDEIVLRECASNSWVDGACAASVWIVGETVLVANIGDVKAVLARVSDKDPTKGQLRAITLSRDHMSIYPQERARILKSGGFVSKDGRLNGKMQVSRSFGDIALKKSGCTAHPDVQAFELTERDKFMLLGCDGFWGVFDAQGAVDEADKLVADESRDEKSVTNRLLNIAVRERGCKDNATVMLLRFSRQT